MYILLLFSLILANPFKPLNKKFLETEYKKNEQPKLSTDSNKEKTTTKYSDKIKGMKRIDGIFEFFVNDSLKKHYINIAPSQLEEEFLIGITRESGDAFMYDGSNMMGEFSFFFKRVGNRIQLIEKNTKFRATPNTPTERSIHNHISNSIWTDAKIDAINPDSLGGDILIDLDKLFLKDINSVSNTNKKLKFDKSNSYFSSIKSYPNNSEIELVLHYKSSNPSFIYTLPDSRSMFHKYHISICSLLSSDTFSPRLADERVGHFTTMYQDYSNIRRESAYVRYINKWNLKKAIPYAKMSYPIKPIIFWLENTIPIEYRPAIIEGIEAWNLAFENIGYKDAIIAKIMPDDAAWDPADVRYNTIRWMIQPGSAYAVGPSRANPYTGEIYDADIRISADYVRYYFTDLSQFVEPLIPQNFNDFLISENDKDNIYSHEKCDYQQFMMESMSFAWNNQISSGINNNIESFIHDALVDLTLHEVGHTLGLRHNFKGSSIYSIAEISDPNFTTKNGVSGSVMDYNSANLMDGGFSYFQTKPGPYDLWAIEYAYSEIPYNLTEQEHLEMIASKSTQNELAYGTDEDTYGQSTRGMDPYCSSRDLSSEPILYYEKQLTLVKEFWNNFLLKFEKNGEKYSRIRQIFSQGLWEYYGAIRNVSKFIGGIENSRHHVGQSNNPPLLVIDGDLQKEAIEFLFNNILSKEAFYFSPELLNKLAPERSPDLRGSVWRMERLDYPIHQRIKQIQSLALYRIFSNRILDRVQDNEIKFTKNQSPFLLIDLFNYTLSSLWDELYSNVNVNSFRRNIQSEHVNVLISIMLDKNNTFSSDASSLARNNLNKLYKEIQNINTNNDFDEYTYSHFKDIGNKIYSAYKAQTSIN